MADNLCRMHRRACARFGSRTALRFKRFGRFQDVNWTDYRRKADKIACGLISLGIQVGDRVAMLSENRVEWLITDHGILSSGAVNVPLHAPLAPDQVAYQVGHSGARGIIVSGQAQADKVIEVLDQLPDLEFVVSFDPVDGLPDRIQHVTWTQLLELARGTDQSNPLHEMTAREAQLSTDSLATIIYTSGTTGNPKGVMLTHGNLLSNAVATGEVSFVDQSHTLLSWLPYSHIYARTVDHYLTSSVGLTVALAESVDTLVANLDEIKPEWLTAVPRFYEKIWSIVETMSDDDKTSTLHKIFGPNVRQLTSGGAPLPRHICEGFFAAGLPCLEGYGLTESSPVIAFNSVDSWRIGSVGRPIPGVEVRIAEDGEILTRGPHVMAGYWNNAEATAETIVDGWLQTGDVGVLDDDGFLAITDRKKDLMITSGGKNVAPSVIERLLISDPLIDQAVLFGDGRQFMSALLVPNFEELSKTVDQTIEPSDDAQFLTDDAVLELLESRVESLMEAVSQPERVRRFLVLARPFQVEDDELTATLKVRRRHIIAKYADELEKLYE